MPEEKARINTEKQEAGRDFYNVAGDYIIHNPITREPVYIPSIQAVLRKGETIEGDFFKKEPEWVDYEQGFIVERIEVDEIIKKMENNKVQLVLGAPASGKSIILKNVGFKLANEGKTVYVVEMKKHPQDEIKLFFENIPKINDENPISIIDDSHLNISECERLIRIFKGRGKGHLIIGSRKTEEIEKGDPTMASEFEYLSKKAIRIQAEDVTQEIIYSFLKQKYNLNDERIKTVSGNLEKFNKDLWYLSWVLKTFKLEKDSVEKEEIYVKIKEKIRNINAEDVFLPMSVFYRFEIPIERKFLEKQLDIKKNIIEQLICLSEIVETEEKGRPVMLSLNHSSLAELYFHVYQNYPSLGEEIKEKLLNGKDEVELEYCSFYRYLTETSPRNVIDVIIYLANAGEVFNLLRVLTEENQIQELIEQGIEKEEDIKKIGWCIFDISRGNNFAALNLVNRININSLSAKIEKEKDIGKISSCISKIAEESEKVGLKLVNQININSLSAKIEKEKDIEKIGWCVRGIADVNKEVGLKLVDSVDFAALLSKIDAEKDIEKIGWCVRGISHANKEVGMKLVNSIDIETLSLKIYTEKNIENIEWCMRDIALVSKEIGLKLFENVDIVSLLLKMNREEGIEKIGWCCARYCETNKEVGLKLVNSIDIEALSSKIDTKEGIEKIGWCVRGIAHASKEVGLKLVNSIDIEALSSKIDKEDDIDKIGACVSGIRLASGEAGLELVESIDIIALSSKIDKEEYIEKIGRCVSIIALASEDVGLKLVEVVSTKINKEDDIENIRRCVSNIALASEDVISGVKFPTFSGLNFPTPL